MRLIVSYTEGDGCTYSCQRDIPVVYDSAEQLTVDIEEVANRIIRGEHREDYFTGTSFNGHTIYVNHFVEQGKYFAPNIYTVDEWFTAADRGEL